VKKAYVKMQLTGVSKISISGKGKTKEWAQLKTSFVMELLPRQILKTKV
jgi:hypothetical protein